MPNKTTYGQVIQIARGNLETRLNQKPLAYGELFINTVDKRDLTTPVFDLVTNSNIKTIFPGDLFAGHNSSSEVYAIGSGGALKWGGVLFDTSTYEDVVQKLKKFPNHIFMYNGTSPVLYTAQEAALGNTQSVLGDTQPKEINKRYESSDPNEYNNKINPGDLAFYNPALDQVIVLHLSHSTDALTKINVDALISDSMRNLLLEADTDEDDSNTNLNRFKEASTLKTFLDGPVRHFQYLTDTSGWSPVSATGCSITRDKSTGKISVERGISSISKDGDGYIHYVPFQEDSEGVGLYEFDGSGISGLETETLREGDLIFSLPTEDGGVTHKKLSLYTMLLKMLRLDQMPTRADQYATDLWSTGIENSYIGDKEFYATNNSLKNFIDRLFTTKVDIDPITHKIVSSQIPDFLLGAPKYMGHVNITPLEWETVERNITAEEFAKKYLLKASSQKDWENLDNNEDDTSGLSKNNTIDTKYYAYKPTRGSTYFPDQTYFTTDETLTTNNSSVYVLDSDNNLHLRTDYKLSVVTYNIIYYAYTNSENNQTFYVKDENPTTSTVLYDFFEDVATPDVENNISAVDNENGTITVNDTIYTKTVETKVVELQEFNLHHTAPDDNTSVNRVSALDMTITTVDVIGNQNNVDDSEDINTKLKSGCYWIYTGETIDNVADFTNIFHLDENVEGGYQQTHLNKGDWIIYNGESKIFEIIDNSGNFLGILVDSIKVSGLVEFLHPKREISKIQERWVNGEQKIVEAQSEETHLEADSTSITFTNPDTVVFKQNANTALTNAQYIPLINNVGYAYSSRYKVIGNQTGLQVEWADVATDVTNIASASLLFHLDETSLTDEDKKISWKDKFWLNTDPAKYQAIDVNTNRIYSNTEDGFNFQWMKFMGNSEDFTNTAVYSYKITLETNPQLSLPQYSGVLTTEKYVNTGFTVIKAMMNDMYDKLLDITTKGHVNWLQTVRLSEEIDPRTGEHRKEIFDSKIKQTFDNNTSFFMDLYYGEEKENTDAINTSTLYSRISVYSTFTTEQAKSWDASTDITLGEGSNAKILNPSSRVGTATVENVLPNHSGILLNNNSVLDGGEWV